MNDHPAEAARSPRAAIAPVADQAIIDTRNDELHARAQPDGDSAAA